MKIETRFNLEQYVYAVTCSQEEVREKCPICKGKGTVTIKGQEYECPECYGDGYKSYLSPKNWHIAYHSQVGEVRVDVIEGYYLEYYMLKATGYKGSGSLWHRDLLFATKKEAEEACAYRNEHNIPYNYSCSIYDPSNAIA